MLPGGSLSAAVLRKPDQQEMLEQLAEAVDIENASPEAKRLHGQLKAGLWTAEDRERGRQMGREKIKREAQENRILWRKVLIQAFIDCYRSGHILHRAGMLMNVEEFCKDYGIKGKSGEEIKRSTIRDWLTTEVVDDIMLEAIARIERGEQHQR
jgi:hypothetical protein